MLYGWNPKKCAICEDVKLCEQTGKCFQCSQMERPLWVNDFIIANEVYGLTTQLSGCDFNGFPQLTLLDTVMRLLNYEVESKTAFMDFLAAIHSHTIRYLSERKGQH